MFTYSRSVALNNSIYISRRHYYTRRSDSHKWTTFYWQFSARLFILTSFVCFLYLGRLFYRLCTDSSVRSSKTSRRYRNRHTCTCSSYIWFVLLMSCITSNSKKALSIIRPFIQSFLTETRHKISFKNISKEKKLQKDIYRYFVVGQKIAKDKYFDDARISIIQYFCGFLLKGFQADDEYSNEIDCASSRKSFLLTQTKRNLYGIRSQRKINSWHFRSNLR